MAYLIATQHGWLRNMFGTDNDTPWHAISENTHRAICGAGPGKWGKGWVYQSVKIQPITCDKCREKIALQQSMRMKKSA